MILDAYSRKVIGWELDDTLEARLAVGALKRALAERGAPLGLVHHSDCGVQYCCRDYVGMLDVVLATLCGECSVCRHRRHGVFRVDETPNCVEQVLCADRFGQVRVHAGLQAALAIP